jgi:hypothetical protein
MRTDWTVSTPARNGHEAHLKRVANGCDVYGFATAGADSPTEAYRQVYTRDTPTVCLTAHVYNRSAADPDDAADRIAGELSALAARLNAAPADADEAMARR